MSDLYTKLDDGEISEAHLKEHYAEAKRLVKELLEGADTANAGHAVIYTQARHWQIDRVLTMIVAHFAVTLHLTGNMRRALETRVKALETTVKALESRPAPDYKGVWKDGIPYMPGSMVTDHGALWLCNAETKARPGGANTGWVLAVKSGSFGNGKEARQ